MPVKSFPVWAAWKAYKAEKLGRDLIGRLDHCGGDEIKSYLSATGLKRQMITARCAICTKAGSRGLTHFACALDIYCKAKDRSDCKEANPNGDCNQFQPICLPRYALRRLASWIPPMR